jgi:hypothetical protein
VNLKGLQSGKPLKAFRMSSGVLLFFGDYAFINAFINASLFVNHPPVTPSTGYSTASKMV